MNALAQQEADRYFEQGQFKSAEQIYHSLQLNSHAAFAALMQEDITQAQNYLLEASDNPLSRWVRFLCTLFINSNKIFDANPGLLTFRLYFEATMGYFYQFKLENFIRIILARRYQLENLYPPLRTELEKAASTSPPNSLGNLGK